VDVARSDKPVPGENRSRASYCGDIEINFNEELSLSLPARNYYWKYRKAEPGLPLSYIEVKLDDYVEGLRKNPNCLTMSEVFCVIARYMEIVRRVAKNDAGELSELTELSRTLRKKT
jgi:hypothetical protein